MKKLLMLILIALLTVLCIVIAVKGFTIGNINVLGFTDIKEQSENLDTQITKASRLVEQDYKQKINTLENNAKELEKAKNEYDEMAAVSTDGDVESANQLERYEIEALYVKLGNHAKSEGTKMRLEIEKDENTAENIYNLRITAIGSYISIEDFVSAIENDSTLGFKIEEFKMVPNDEQDGSSNKTNTNKDKNSVTTLKATFVCKGIEIKEITMEQPEQLDENGNPIENTTANTTDNTTNATKTNSTSNTTKTNSTNTTNTTN